MRLDAEVQTRLRTAIEEQPLRMLLRLFLLGCPVPEAEVQVALSAAMLAALAAAGLLVPSSGAPGSLISPVQVYPLYPPPPTAGAQPLAETLLLATDVPIDTLLPGKCAVMAIGTDSLELARHPPRPRKFLKKLSSSNQMHKPSSLQLDLQKCF